jgi:hypothetical protein
MNRHSKGAREKGSAYIIALLVLLVLSLLGLSLTLITQTEVQISSNELTAHRALYGAEAGLEQSLARFLTVNSSIGAVRASNVDGGADPEADDEGAINPEIEEIVFEIPEVRLTVDDNGVMTEITPGVNDPRFAERVTVSPFVPIRDTPCDMCPAAEGDVQLVHANHALIATARRVIEQDGNSRETVSKRLYMMMGVQPWWPPRWESIADGTAAAEVVQEAMGGFDETTP